MSDYETGGSVFNSINSVVNLSGVVAVGVIGYGNCSGELISPTLILTAAHCSGGNSGVSTYVSFPDGSLISGTTVADPAYDDNPETGSDLEVIELSGRDPAATVYSLYTGSTPLRSALDLAGYGYSGTGTTGYNTSLYGYGTLRAGQNEYDTTACYITGDPCLLMGDFDDGQSTNNVYGDTGLYDEIDISYGDSGGPTFYDGQLIGVHDVVSCDSDPSTSKEYGGSTNCITNQPASLYGETFGDTSVAGNITWIDGQIAAAAAPEPSTWLLCFGALGAAVMRRKRF